MKTIAQQLNIKKFPFSIKDKNGKVIYWERPDGFWFKQEFDSEGNQIYLENSKEYWSRKVFDPNGNITYFENSDGYWSRTVFNSFGNEIYYEDSKGFILDNRPKLDNGPKVELSMQEIADKFGIKIEELKIKGI